MSQFIADTYLIYSGCGDTVYAWRRGTELKHVYRVVLPEEGGSDGGPAVRHILPFGPSLITVDAKSVLRVWDIKSQDLIKTINFDREEFEITALCHPLTYKDKILLGR